MGPYVALLIAAVSIPLESGHIVILLISLHDIKYIIVSIPLESGHIVI